MQPLIYKMQYAKFIVNYLLHIYMFAWKVASVTQSCR